jgi:hypothetical protein
MKNVQLIISAAVINNPTWSKSDLKTTWLSRARMLGIEGYSALLRDSFN